MHAARLSFAVRTHLRFSAFLGHPFFCTPLFFTRQIMNQLHKQEAEITELKQQHQRDQVELLAAKQRIVELENKLASLVTPPDVSLRLNAGEE